MSTTWDELMGSNNWVGLLEPELNQGLREFILSCGNFCQATYDCFNSDKLSPNCGNSRYGIDSFFADVMLQDANKYQVVAFLYATSGIGDPTENAFFHPGPAVLEPWDRQSNWMGYVAITTEEVSKTIGRREVYVVWRGTITISEWISNLYGTITESAKLPLAPTSQRNAETRVHGGWLSIYTSSNVDSNYGKESARQRLHRVIQAIRNKYPNDSLSVVVTGHSLGGALATLTAFDLVENKVAGDNVRVSAFIFGCPQVGSQEFKNLVDAHSNLKILHVFNRRDIVPITPDYILPFYVPIQTSALVIDTFKSPYLNSKGDWINDFHNLEATLHVVAWWNGPHKSFDIEKVIRSLALVNKSSRYLAVQLKIPEYWWIEKNKGMKYDKSAGMWVLGPPPKSAEEMLKIALN